MPLHIATYEELKQLIDNCQEFEGKYYLLPLLVNLAQSNRPADRLEPVARRLILIISHINQIKNTQLPQDKRLEHVKQILTHYNALIKEIGASGIMYKTKQALLDFGGYIIGFFAGVLGGIVGSITLVLKDIVELQLPTGFFMGGFTGFFVGFIMGRRVPHTLLKESETRLIRHTVRKLATSFESLFESLQHDYLSEIKQEILNDYFFGNQEQFSQFLQTQQTYEILGIEAEFFSARFKGSLGHHSFIKFTINNIFDKPKLIELGMPSDAITEISQRESRTTTGEQLLRMLTMHKILSQQYELSLRNLFRFYQRYEAGINDCQTYVDKILISVDEPVSQVKRFTDSDTIFGHIIGTMLNFFSPLPTEKRQLNIPNTPINRENIDEFAVPNGR
ncbi:hypothetical protein [Legionella worsleiensis]|uniref:Uncharacterized protein n=1 Tax=Legionella worsleiensis TaxID=45076 RepID=A0A0W1AFU9_9GAMM|nr:hypothetical protein [Legionella worsleiensis]KTD80198.1 hypothetical protein Lwor_1106 [Legionella worsleiensis]STY31752.1 Uncharacterised protein [Legionella worsleiensis]